MRHLAILLAALPLLSQAPAAPSPSTSPAHPPRGQRLAEALGLSPEQQAKLEALRAQHAAALKADREALQAQGRQLRGAMQDPSASEAQLRQAFDRMNEARFKALLDRRALRQEMRAVLTPDQQAKADALKAEFRERHRARMERRVQMMQRRLQQGQPEAQNP